MSRFIVLPSPLPSSSIALGQLIADPTHAEVISFNPSTKPTGQHSDIQSNPGYPARGSLFTLSAEQSSHISLTQPTTTFNAIRNDATARSVLRKSAQKHQPLYYVTGIQTLKAPVLKHATAKGDVAEAPATGLRLPIHVRRVDSVTNIDNDNINEKLEDSIFAVELLKVRCRVGAASEPHSLQDIGYDWSYHSLGDEDLQLSIGLGHALDAAELNRLAGAVAGEDFTDDSWGSRSDDDGIGGF
ncbi:hypothetical protein GQ44DRAFT_336709 [Phaeosphaeriaceae sp. PMI808]|nr:hypothetical protein GQ44DRAFT_336709 [Phaeosphaeriaceae sp. PMI808]